MKKFILLLFALLGSALLMGQPTLQYPQNVPFIGDVYQIQFVDPSDLDLSTIGPDVSWDFSGLTSLYGGEIIAIDPATAPAGGDFPEADVALSMGDTIFTFVQTNESGYFYLGSQSTTGTFPSLLIYSDSRTFLHFPFTYDDTHFDTYKGVVTTAAATVHNSAASEMFGDSWGTLMLPNGTFNNVLRIITVDAEIDSVFVAGNFVKSFALVRTQYSWFAVDSKGPLLSVEVMNNAGLGTVDTVAYYTTSAIGIEEATADAAFDLSVFPNPADEHITVSYKLSGDWETNISIVNQVGQLMISKEVISLTKGQINEIIDISTLPAGIYFVSVSCDCGGHLTGKFIIK